MLAPLLAQKASLLLNSPSSFSSILWYESATPAFPCGTPSTEKATPGSQSSVGLSSLSTCQPLPFAGGLLEDIWHYGVGASQCYQN